VHLILGSILASLVVLAFMRNWRSTVIAAVAIPASVVATFGIMRALDFTLNSVTMLALVLMVGVVIDDAIVVLENIFRFVEEKGMKPFERQGQRRRHRPCRHGYDAFSRRYLYPGFIYVEHFRTLSLSVRHYRSGCRHGEPARLFHPHAHDERTPVARSANHVR